MVGHSYGGFVITNAATGNPNIKALVYVDAFIPDQGETLAQLTSAQLGSCLAGNPADIFNLVPYPGAPAGDVDTYIEQSLVPSCFASGLPVAQAAVIAATQRSLAASMLGEASGPPAWKNIPSWDLIGTADRVLPPAEQNIHGQARRCPHHQGERRAPVHDRRPRVVAQVIEQAAQAAR